MNNKVIYSQTNCFIFTMTNKELLVISLGEKNKHIMKNRIVMCLTRGSVEMLFVGESSPASVLFFVLRCILYTSDWPPPARLVHPIITRRSYSYDVIALKRTENITNAGQEAQVVTLLLCICLFTCSLFLQCCEGSDVKLMFSCVGLCALFVFRLWRSATPTNSSISNSNSWMPHSSSLLGLSKASSLYSVLFGWLWSHDNAFGLIQGLFRNCELCNETIQVKYGPSALSHHMSFVIQSLFSGNFICIQLFCLRRIRLLSYTLKNKGASKGSSSDAIEELFLVPQRIIQSKVL